MTFLNMPPWVLEGLAPHPGGQVNTILAPYAHWVGFICMGGAPKDSPNRPRHPHQTPPHMNKTKHMGVWRSKTAQGTSLYI